MNRVILYHGNCYDGFGAALAAYLAFGHDATYRAVNYGEEAPDVTGSELWLLDFSYPRDVIERLAAVNVLRILDHHKTAEDALTDFPGATFDRTRSGATITYGTLFPNQQIPVLFRYLEDRDLWRFALPHSREVHAYVAAHAYDFDVWCGLMLDLENDFYTCAASGAVVMQFQQRQVEMMAAHARVQRVGQHDVPTVNATAFWSELGEELLLRFSDAPFVAMYWDRGDGRRVWSLRSNGFDVSAVAKLYGGGGHVKAAGFVV